MRKSFNKYSHWKEIVSIFSDTFRFCCVRYSKWKTLFSRFEQAGEIWKWRFKLARDESMNTSCSNHGLRTSRNSDENDITIYLLPFFFLLIQMYCVIKDEIKHGRKTFWLFLLNKRLAIKCSDLVCFRRKKIENIEKGWES